MNNSIFNSRKYNWINISRFQSKQGLHCQNSTKITVILNQAKLQFLGVNPKFLSFKTVFHLQRLKNCKTRNTTLNRRRTTVLKLVMVKSGSRCGTRRDRWVQKSKHSLIYSNVPIFVLYKMCISQLILMQIVFTTLNVDNIITQSDGTQSSNLPKCHRWGLGQSPLRGNMENTQTKTSIFISWK